MSIFDIKFAYLVKQVTEKEANVRIEASSERQALSILEDAIKSGDLSGLTDVQFLDAYTEHEFGTDIETTILEK